MFERARRMLGRLVGEINLSQIDAKGVRKSTCQDLRIFRWREFSRRKKATGGEGKQRTPTRNRGVVNVKTGEAS